MFCRKLYSQQSQKRSVGVVFSEYVSYICSNILTNTESVSLFLCNERRKFDRRGSKPTTCRVISFIRDRRGAVAYFIFEVSYDQSD